MMRRRKNNFKPILPRPAGSTTLSSKLKQKKTTTLHEKSDTLATVSKTPDLSDEGCKKEAEETAAQSVSLVKSQEDFSSTQACDVSSKGSSQSCNISSSLVPLQEEGSFVSSTQLQDNLEECIATVQSQSTSNPTKTLTTSSPLPSTSTPGATTPCANTFTLSPRKGPPVNVAIKAVSSSKPKKHPIKEQDGSETKAFKQRLALNKLKRMELDKITKQNKWGNLDRNMLSMCDLIYINPSKSDGKELGIRAKLRQLKDSSFQPTEQAPPSPTLTQPNIEQNVEPEDSREEQSLVPQIRVNEDGAIVLDEESLTIKSPQRAGGPVLESSAVYESEISNVNQCSFRRKIVKSRWTEKQTAKFYFALGVVGADFSLMSAMFRHRSRDELRRKFHLENRKNVAKVDEALKSQHLSKWTNEMFMPKSSSEDETPSNTQPPKKRKRKTNLHTDNKNNKNKEQFAGYLDDNAQINSSLEEPVAFSTLDLAADVTVSSPVLLQEDPFAIPNT